MDDLVAWYRTQLDDEERVLAGSGVLGWLTFRNPDGSMDHTEAAARAGDGTWIVAGSERTGYASAVVMYREAQRRREVQAERWVVDEYARLCEYARLEGGDRPSDPAMHVAWALLDKIVRLNAAAYADRPGYRAEWRP